MTFLCGLFVNSKPHLEVDEENAKAIASKYAVRETGFSVNKLAG